MDLDDDFSGEYQPWPILLYDLQKSVAYYGEDIPCDPPHGHNHATSGKWVIWREPEDFVRSQFIQYPELPDDAPSPLFREPEEPLEPGEVFEEEEEEYWPDGLWDRLWEEVNGKTWLMWQSFGSQSFSYTSGSYCVPRSLKYKCPRRESRKNRNRNHRIKQPGGSSCNQRRI